MHLVDDICCHANHINHGNMHSTQLTSLVHSAIYTTNFYDRRVCRTFADHVVCVLVRDLTLLLYDGRMPIA